MINMLQMLRGRDDPNIPKLAEQVMQGLKDSVPSHERDWWRRLLEKLVSPFPNCNAVEAWPPAGPPIALNGSRGISSI